jgi:glycosyltransferase involved in cell wall biosynthesis
LSDHQDDGWPSVSVVIATRDRVELLRRAVTAALEQCYPGSVEVLVVHDQSEPDPSIEQDRTGRRVRVLVNSRTPGLPGARNTGITAASGDLIAFCDDDDEWLAGKLKRQVDAMRQHRCGASTTGIVVVYSDREVVRLATKDVLTPLDFAHSRVMAAHPSTFLMERDLLLGPVGLVDESIPGAYGEDFDLILRVARATLLVSVQEPLVRVLWHRQSFFAQRWRAIADSTDYLLAKHPELRSDRHGLAEHLGRKAFALAALRQPGAAVRSAWQSLRLSRGRERRAYLAIAITAHIVNADRVMRLANSVGKGI